MGEGDLMLNLMLRASGKTLSDIVFAVETAVAQIADDFTSGFNSNDDGDYEFTLDGEEEA